MRSMAESVESRCAIASTVRPCISLASARWTAISTFGIERRGRLVEKQDRGVLQDGARDAEPLALAARELGAALADERCRSPAGSSRMKPSQ